MLKSNIAVVTYIYPSVIKYFDDLLLSIVNQTTKNFVLIIFSDFITINQFGKPIPIEYKFIMLKGTPIEIRFKSLDILRTLSFDKYIFIDADDTMSVNRISVVSDLLEKYPLVCNDLNLMNLKSEIYAESIWKIRFKNRIFTSDFIKDKNVVGFGCTSVSKELLFHPCLFSGSPLVGDWFIFYQFLRTSGAEAAFTSDCQTNYRQYSDNQVGIKAVCNETISLALKVKKEHYSALIGLGFIELIEHYNNILYIEKNRKYQVINNNLPDYPFWWEETNYIKYKR